MTFISLPTLIEPVGHTVVNEARLACVCYPEVCGAQRRVSDVNVVVGNQDESRRVPTPVSHLKPRL